MWNGAKMWAVTLSSGSLILTLASHDVEKDPFIVDHLFAEVPLVLNLLIVMWVWCIISDLLPLSIKSLTYFGVPGMLFDVIYICYLII